jgi:hypothetical protein
MMNQNIYTQLPPEKIEHLNRAEFVNGTEHVFHDALTASMKKYGFKDPVYCWYCSKRYGNRIKVLVGNNRLVVAKELKIPLVPAIISNFKPKEFPLEGRVLKTDDEIRALFYLPDQLQIRRDQTGEIDQIMPPHFLKVRDKYV